MKVIKKLKLKKLKEIKEIIIYQNSISKKKEQRKIN